MTLLAVRTDREIIDVVTRDIAIRVGITFMEFGRGIGRGNNINRNDQDVTMFGTTFGIDFRR